jgi:hypothetical protein
MSDVTLGTISTGLPTLPDLGSDPSSSDELNFEKSLMLFQEAFDAKKTEISTIGDANSGAAGTKPQPS